MITGNEKTSPKVGDAVRPDLWRAAEPLTLDDGFSDSSFPGCQFRLPTSDGLYELAVNITITGKPHWNGYGRTKSRCRIEFVKDGGEPSVFSGGWLFQTETEGKRYSQHIGERKYY